MLKYTSPRFGNFEFAFDRINVILGANGAGKSKLMMELRDSISRIIAGKKAVFIEGGRTIKLVDVIQFDMKNFQKFDRLESAIQQHERKRAISLADRIFDAIVVLEKKELQLKSSHSDAVEAWNSRGRMGDYPNRPTAPLTRLFDLFAEIFPKITLTFDYQGRRLTVQQGDQQYGPSDLSDGEKQVFSILADLIELDETHQAIIVDEPELNLHPELAERLWTLVENEFPTKLFVYATHSISFALRENIQKVYVLSSTSQNVSEFTGLECLPRTEVTAFLGGLPGILSASRVVVTEGHEKSFDAIFYRWLLDDSRLEIYPAGGCADVINVVSRTGLWERISTNVSLCGAIDADFRGDDYLTTLANNRITLLPLHEAESYLCLPEILCAIAERIGSQENPLTHNDVQRVIIEALQSQRLSIAARRVIARAKINLAVSVERHVLTRASTRDALVVELRIAAQAEIAKASTSIGPQQLESLIDTELANIDTLIRANDYVQALRLLPGKELLNRLAPRAGCRNGTDLMRSLKRNFGPADFSRTLELKKAIEAHATP